MKQTITVLCLLLCTMPAWPITEGYVNKQSVFPGEAVTFHVSTLADSFYLEVYRKGATMQLITTIKAPTGRWFTGHNYYLTGQNYAANGCNWTAATSYTIPAGWKSGLYVVRIVANKDTGTVRMNYASRYYQDRLLINRMIFTVKSATPGVQTKILQVLAFNTYQAYNGWGGGSYYYSGGILTTVSFLRPYGDYDGYNQGPTDWDYKFIQWAEGEGYVLDYCVDTDLDRDAALTQNFVNKYKLLVVNGHNEYWSVAMRNCVLNFQNQIGGNVFFCSGNSAWWEVTFSGGYTQMIKGPNFYGNDFMGARFENSYNIYHPARYGHYPVEQGFGGMTVSTVGETSWVFAGTGLRAGDKFGTQSLIVGYEVDGLMFNRSGYTFTPAETAPAGLKILAANTYTGGGKSGCDRDAYFTVPVCFSIFKRGAGTFVNEGNVNWAYGLVSDSGATDVASACENTWKWIADPAVKQITRNIFTRLGDAPVRAESAPCPTTPKASLRASPNPFAGSVRLDFTVVKGDAALRIYGLDGRLIREYPLRTQSGSVRWDGNAAAGCYVARLEQGKTTASSLLILK